MKNFKVEMVRTYTTEFNIEADNYQEAAIKFKAMGDAAYEAELEQCNVNEEVTIYGQQWARKCDKCQKGMFNGYLAADSYYCSDECLHQDYTYDEFINLSEQCDDDYYWTEWDDKNDLQYQEINGIITEIN